MNCRKSFCRGFGLVVPALLALGSTASATNIALNKPAWASDTYLPTTGAEKAVDGQYGTLWNAPRHATSTNPAWLVVDLQQAYSVGAVTLVGAAPPYWYSGYTGFTNDYNLYSSLNGGDWFLRGSGTLVDTYDPVDTINFGGALARYMKYEVVGGTHWAYLHEMEVTATTTPLPAQLYAVIVGERDGSHRFDLDAIGIKSALLGWSGIQEANMQCLTNPSYDTVKDAIGQVAGKIRPIDKLLFFFSGHGSYLNTNDEPTVLNSPIVTLAMGGELLNRGDELLWLNPANQITDDQLSANDMLGDPRLAAVSKLVILDSCMSGGFMGSPGNQDDSGDLDKLQNTALLAACSESEFAFTFPTGNHRGMFSVVVEQALTVGSDGYTWADSNKDRVVSFEELRAFLLWNYRLNPLDMGLIRTGSFPWIDNEIEVQINSLGGLYAYNTSDFDPNAPFITPEPGSMLLLVMGGAWVLAVRSRARRALLGTGHS